MTTTRSTLRVLSLILLLTLTGAWGPAPVHAAAIHIDLPGPPGSGEFGTSVAVLPNANFVVTDPYYDGNRGAVYLYSPDRVLISRLTGSLMGDHVGDGGIAVLTNGNYVVLSPYWSSGPAYAQLHVGAVTWCSQWTGCDGVVSAANSLVGSNTSDQVGGNFFGPVTALTNGNYVVSSPYWDSGTVVNAGAVTWGDGTSGTAGVVSDANSLVGSTAYDEVGGDYEGSVTALTNGNYLVRNAAWDNGGLVDAGAITWGNGLGGTEGPVSEANSLVGSTAQDQVGGIFDRVTELANGNYVVSSQHWDNGDVVDAGAVTWGSGTMGAAGPISPANSLLGTSSDAPVGDLGDDNLGVTALANGNYVVSSPYWSPDGTASHFGAVTWGSGTTGVAGTISATNSLVGSSYGDSVGTVIALTNGNYVVSSPYWALDEVNVNAGAVTWGDGSTGITGPVSAVNSLVGHSLTCMGDGGVIALANGNYAVSSPAWYVETGGPPNIGAVTWGDGATGTTGPVSTANSLVGVNTYDAISDGGLVALTNGNYVVVSRSRASSVGTITWVDGSHAATGTVTAANSLVGTKANDAVGGGLWSSGVIALTNGNYVVSSPWWDNGDIVDAGAITWGDGTAGTTGVVSAANSLVGSAQNDRLGTYFWDGGVTVLANGNYVVSSPQWDSGTAADAGAVTWGNGTGGTIGPVSAANSLVGSSAGDGVGQGSFWGAAGVTELATGNYVVNSPHWSSVAAVGAVTWGDGSGGVTGLLSAANSLVNTSANDEVFCSSTLTPCPDGNASLHLPSWSDGSHDGAVSLLACGTELLVGPVGTANSVLGAASLGGDEMVSGYDLAHAQLIVGRPADNVVTILRCHAGPLFRAYLPLVMK